MPFHLNYLCVQINTKNIQDFSFIKPVNFSSSNTSRDIKLGNFSGNMNFTININVNTQNIKIINRLEKIEILSFHTVTQDSNFQYFSSTLKKDRILYNYFITK